MRRPLHSLTSALTAVHHGFELAAGTGLVFQPYMGLPGAAVFWSVGLPGWFAAGAVGSRRWDRPLAVLAGLSMGAAAVHFTLWPSKRKLGFPLLTEAEGLKPGQLPVYNAVLYAWALAGLSALVVESPRGSRRWALAGLLASVPLRLSARHHFTWIREEARRNPSWWNRALSAEPAP